MKRSDVDVMLAWTSCNEGRRKHHLMKICMFVIAIALTAEAITHGLEIVARKELLEGFKSDPDSFLCKSLKYAIAIPVIVGIGWVGDYAGRLQVILGLLCSIVIFSLLSLIDSSSESFFLISYTLVHACFAPALVGFACIVLFESLAAQFRTPAILALYFIKSLLGLVSGLIYTHATGDRRGKDDWPHSVISIALTALIPLSLGVAVGYDTAGSLLNRGYTSQAYQCLLKLGGINYRIPPPIHAAEFGISKQPKDDDHHQRGRKGTHALIQLVTKSAVIVQEAFLATFFKGFSAASSPMAALAINQLACSFGIVLVLLAWLKNVKLSFVHLVAVAFCTVSCLLLLPAGDANGFFSNAASVGGKVELAPLIAIGSFLGSLASEIALALVMIASLNFHSNKGRSLGVALSLAGEAVSKFTITVVHESRKTESLFYALQICLLMLIFFIIVYLMRKNERLENIYGQGILDNRVLLLPCEIKRVSPQPAVTRGQKQACVVSRKVILPESPKVVHKIHFPTLSFIPSFQDLIPSAPVSPVVSDSREVVLIEQKIQEPPQSFWKSLKFWNKKRRVPEEKKFNCASVSEAPHVTVV